MSDPNPSQPQDSEAGFQDLPVFATIGGRDGQAIVEVSLSEDEMIAYARFQPARNAQAPMIVFGEFLERLQESGIVFGYVERNIQEAIFHCNMEHKFVDRVVIARGNPAKGERPAFLKLEPHIYQHHFADKGALKVDFKEVSPFVIVKKGELLARAIKPREGLIGQTVTGKDVPPGKKEIKILKPGPHTIFAHGKVFSKEAGRLLIEGDMFDVSDTLEIQAGVDYHTGHILFPGNIQIGGLVQDGFKIVAGGSITVREALDASEVMSKKELVCGGGIIGKKPGIVRCGSSVKALFIENCQVEALGDIHLSKAALNSKVYTNGNLILEEGGRIVSSTVFVKGNVVCTQLGNESGGCHITVGIDFVQSRKLEALRAHYKEEEDQLFKAKSRLEQAGVGKIQEMEAEIRQKLETLVKEMNEITPLLFNPNPVTLTVTGIVHPGCVIEMGYARLPIVGKLKSKVFRLSEDQKSIVVEKSGSERS